MELERKKVLVEKFKRDREEVLAAEKRKRDNDLLVAEEERKQQLLAARPSIEQRDVLLRNKEVEKKIKQVSFLCIIQT